MRDVSRFGASHGFVAGTVASAKNLKFRGVNITLPLGG